MKEKEYLICFVDFNLQLVLIFELRLKSAKLDENKNQASRNRTYIAGVKIQSPNH